MQIIPVACLDDNYAYLIIDATSKDAAAVDPVAPQNVMSVAKQHDANIKMILTTHKHWDHAGGNKEMVRLNPGIRVLGGSEDSVEGCTEPVHDGDELSLGNEIHIRALHTPCHTKGHISYYVTSASGGPAVFTGDTLFVGGCGKFFEGSAEQMYHSLCEKLGTLPPSTRVYCGHEYTEKNLKFALTVEPNNLGTKEKMEWVQQQRKNNKPTVPSTIREELETNPFMRVNLQQLKVATGCNTPIEVMAHLRKSKDSF